MRFNNFFKLVIAIVISELAGIVGSFFTISAIPNPSTSSGQAWYSTLLKPALNPPAWVFGPVWTTLYALMGISLFLIWKINPSEARVGERRRAVTLFFIQLSLNTLWSIIFFGLHGSTWLTINNLGWAFVDIVLLWLAIVWTMVIFYKISKPAAWLLVPYILWVSFAMYLNYAIWALN